MIRLSLAFRNRRSLAATVSMSVAEKPLIQHQQQRLRHNSPTIVATSATHFASTTKHHDVPGSGPSNSENSNLSGASDSDFSSEPSTTHFGFQNVSTASKENLVRTVFDNVAESYDIMNDLMSAGLHRIWKDEFLNMTGVEAVARALRHSNAGTRGETLNFAILDVAGGTGDIAFRFLDAAHCQERSKSSGPDEISVTVCDINTEMLRVGERRARKRYGNAILDDSRALTFVEGNAQSLPFDKESFDLYTIAFGLRNVTNIDMALHDAYRVLKPGGRFLCLEFSHIVGNPVLSSIYDMYSFHIIPAIGEAVAKDRASYQYLVESIRKFSGQDELKGRIEDAGFIKCKYRNMMGGIVAVHEGWKSL